MNYEFQHQDKVYTPDGTCRTVTAKVDVEAHNRNVEREQLKWIATLPDKLFLYVKHDTVPNGTGEITTFMGTVIAKCYLGDKKEFQTPNNAWSNFRRAVSVVIHGQRYYGWYMESSGNYCRLRKARVKGK